MLVGKINIRESDLIEHSSTYEDLRSFCKTLLPDSFKDNESLLDNQVYYCCLLLRRLDTISWERKKAVINTAMCSIRVIGCVTSIESIDNVYTYLDLHRLQTYIESEVSVI